MAAVIRQLGAADAGLWIDLLRASLGPDYPDGAVYEPAWFSKEVSPATGHETWAAVDGSRILASASFLQPASQNINPVINLGRQLFHPDSFANGSAEALVGRINELAAERRQIVVSRVPATDNAQ